MANIIKNILLLLMLMTIINTCAVLDDIKKEAKLFNMNYAYFGDKYK